MTWSSLRKWSGISYSKSHPSKEKWTSIMLLFFSVLMSFFVFYFIAPPGEDCTSVTDLPNAFEGPITISMYLFSPWLSFPILGEKIRCISYVSYLNGIALISLRLTTGLQFTVPLLLYVYPNAFIVPETSVTWELLSHFLASLWTQHCHLPDIFPLFNPLFST